MSAARLAVEGATAVLALVGAVAALVGSLGLVRLRPFLRRLHAPTLASTAGTWALALATALQVSLDRGQIFAHALLVPAFLAITTPVTTVFLVRAAVFRARVAGNDAPPPSPRSARTGRSHDEQHRPS